MTATFDMSDMDRLAQQLTASDGPVRDAAKKSIKRGAMNVKRSARAKARGFQGSHGKRYASSIEFEVMDGGLAAEIGPTLGRMQAFLGKIYEFGTATSPAHPHMIPAAEEEQDKIADGMAQAVAKELRNALQ